MDILRNVGEIGFGILLLAGAIFNLAYTLRHSKELYGSFAANAWFRSYRALIQRMVIPHAMLFTILLIAFQASVGLMLLTRGSLVNPALIAGAVFGLGVIPASNLVGAMANLGLGVALALLALTG